MVLSQTPAARGPPFSRDEEVDEVVRGTPFSRDCAKVRI
jgi:hypothetical protein